MITKFINDITITAAITLAICGISTAVYTANINKMHQAEIAVMQSSNNAPQEVNDNAQVIKAAFGFSDSIVDSLCKNNNSEDCELYQREIKPMLKKYNIK